MNNESHPLYSVIHGEFSPGYQSAQLAHSVTVFAMDKPHEFAKWFHHNQYIIMLQVPSRADLEVLMRESAKFGHDFTFFKEPDLDNEITAITFNPHRNNKDFLRDLKLAGQTNGNENARTSALD